MNPPNKCLVHVLVVAHEATITTYTFSEAEAAFFETDALSLDHIQQLLHHETLALTDGSFLHAVNPDLLYAQWRRAFIRQLGEDIALMIGKKRDALRYLGFSVLSSAPPILTDDLLTCIEGGLGL